jgi:hypothetical protein
VTLDAVQRTHGWKEGTPNTGPTILNHVVAAAIATFQSIVYYRIIWKISRPAYSMVRCGRAGLGDGLGDGLGNGLGVPTSSDAGEVPEQRHPLSPQINNPHCHRSPRQRNAFTATFQVANFPKIQFRRCKVSFRRVLSAKPDEN